MIYGCGFECVFVDSGGFVYVLGETIASIDVI